LIGDAGSVAIVFAVLLAGRALIVYGFGALARWRRRDLPWRWQHAIAWGGLRGAVPIALALGLPADLAGRDTLLIIVFGVVFLSLLVQGLTMPVLLRRLKLARTEPAVDEDEATAEKSDMSRRQADSERVE